MNENQWKVAYALNEADTCRKNEHDCYEHGDAEGRVSADIARTLWEIAAVFFAKVPSEVVVYWSLPEGDGGAEVVPIRGDGGDDGDG